jgi:hypothetical protein
VKRNGSIITTDNSEEIIDIVGRYNVTIGGKTYDTVCIMDIGKYNSGIISEQFLDKSGRTILWRRFNPDNWLVERYGGKTWSERFPNSERLVVNGVTCVHSYDCITDYIL